MLMQKLFLIFLLIGNYAVPALCCACDEIVEGVCRATYLEWVNDDEDFDCLNGVTTVNGTIRISSTIMVIPELNITTINGYLDISNCPNLQTIGGLSKLATINGFLSFDTNPNLVNLDGLDNLSSISDGLFITSHVKLTNVDALSRLTSVNELKINYNTALVDLNGLAGLTVIEGDFDTRQNDNLSILNFPNLQSISGNWLLEGPNMLVSFSVPQLTTIGGYLFISSNEYLENLDGLPNLTTVNGDLDVDANFALRSFHGLSSLALVNGSFSCSGDMENIDGLSALTKINGDLRISNCEYLLNVDGLSALQEVSRDLIIANNMVLEDIDGLASLSTVGNISIEGNFELKNVGGLCGVSSPASRFTFINNFELQCMPTSVPITNECPCFGSECACCESYGTCPAGKYRVRNTQTNIIRGSETVAPITANLKRGDSNIEIGNVYFASDALAQDDVLSISAVNFTSELIDEITQQPLVSSLISLSLNSGVSQFASNSSVRIQLRCSNSTQRFGLYYFNTTTNALTFESFAFRKTSTGEDGVIYAEAFTSHFTDFTFLLVGGNDPVSSSTADGSSVGPVDGDGDGDGDGQDGGESSGLPSGALAGIIIGCVVFAILVIIVIVVVATIVTIVLRKQKHPTSSGVINYGNDDDADEL